LHFASMVILDGLRPPKLAAKSRVCQQMSERNLSSLAGF
jgi:hypothetical protein